MLQNNHSQKVHPQYYSTRSENLSPLVMKKHKTSKGNTIENDHQKHQKKIKSKHFKKQCHHNQNNMNEANIKENQKANSHIRQNMKQVQKKQIGKNIMMNTHVKDQTKNTFGAKRRKSNEKLYKSKSMVKLNHNFCSKTQKISRCSPSPLISRENGEKKIIGEKNMFQQKLQEYQNQLNIVHGQTNSIISKNTTVKLKKVGSKSKLRKYEKEDNKCDKESKINRLSIQTQMSSKLQSIIRQVEKKDEKHQNRNQKIKKIQRVQKNIKNAKNKRNTCTTLKNNQSKNKLEDLKPKKVETHKIIKKSILYSEVSFQEYFPPTFEQRIEKNHHTKTQGNIIKKEHQNYMAKFYIEEEKLSSKKKLFTNKKLNQKLNENQAALMIQKCFRGYIVRKYLSQIKSFIGKVTLIQLWWKNILKLRKEKQENTKQRTLNEEFQKERFYVPKQFLANNSKKNMLKPIETSLSLETIQDFNSSIKEIRNRFLTTEQAISPVKLNTTEQVHLKDILKNILEDEEINEEFKNKIRRRIQENQEKDHRFQENEKGSEKSMSGLKTPRQTQIKGYIQNKIKSQISSEKVFNSPCLISPNALKVKSPSNVFLNGEKDNIKKYFHHSQSSISYDQKIKQFMVSPSRSAQKNVTPRSNHKIIDFQKAPKEQLENMNSPKIDNEKNESNFSLQKKQKVDITEQIKQQQQTQYEAFVTSFQFIQQFCLLLIDYLRDTPNGLSLILQQILQMKYFKINLMLKHWNKKQLMLDLEKRQGFFNEEEESISEVLSDYYLKERYERPVLFSLNERRNMLQFSSLKIFLEDHQYDEAEFGLLMNDEECSALEEGDALDREVLWKESKIQMHFLKAIFDGLGESIYSQYCDLNLRTVHLLHPSIYVSAKTNVIDLEEQLFQNIFANALGTMHENASQLCGLINENQSNQEDDPEEQLRWEKINQERLELMAKQIQKWNWVDGHLGIALEIAQLIYQQLLFELSQEKCIHDLYS